MSGAQPTRPNRNFTIPLHQLCSSSHLIQRVVQHHNKCSFHWCEDNANRSFQPQKSSTLVTTNTNAASLSALDLHECAKTCPPLVGRIIWVQRAMQCVNLRASMGARFSLRRAFACANNPALSKIRIGEAPPLRINRPPPSEMRHRRSLRPPPRAASRCRHRDPHRRTELDHSWNPSRKLRWLIQVESQRQKRSVEETPDPSPSCQNCQNCQPTPLPNSVMIDCFGFNFMVFLDTV